MITLEDFKNNNLKINWKVIDIGCLGSEIFKNLKKFLSIQEKFLHTLLFLNFEYFLYLLLLYQK